VIGKVLIDSDVILDVATGRTQFVTNSRLVLAVLERRSAYGIVSAHSITNIYSILRKLTDAGRALTFLREILQFLSVGPVSHNDIVLSLDAGLPDFEDAVQYHCARSNGCDGIVTRNTKDFPGTGIPVYDPGGFVALFA